jgi:restriction system protein
MLPLLQLASDGKEHRFREAVEVLAARLALTDEDRKVLIPSGTQPQFENRLGWALTELVKAGVMERPARGLFRITPRGETLLREHPEGITVGLLRQFPEFAAFKYAVPKASVPTAIETDSAYSPEELLGTSYAQLRQQVAQELLERVKAASPQFFERLVVQLLVAMGYGGTIEDAGRTVGQSGDGGIDGIIKEDKLGLDNIYIQAKRWQGSVGSPVVQGFAGSMDGQRGRKGVLITTSSFTKDAQQSVNRIDKRIVLIDGEQLALLMLDHSVGVTRVETYEVKKVDLDFFEEGG